MAMELGWTGIPIPNLNPRPRRYPLISMSNAYEYQSNNISTTYYLKYVKSHVNEISIGYPHGKTSFHPTP
jgi:hypothetical protein